MYIIVSCEYEVLLMDLSLGSFTITFYLMNINNVTMKSFCTFAWKYYYTAQKHSSSTYPTLYKNNTHF